MDIRKLLAVDSELEQNMEGLLIDRWGLLQVILDLVGSCSGSCGGTGCGGGGCSCSNADFLLKY